MVAPGFAIRRTSFALIAALLMAFPHSRALAQHPSWINSAVIYCVYPEIFSSSGFQGVTVQLNRLSQLGVNVISLMPVTPVGQPYNGRPAFDSPYAVHDYYANGSFNINTLSFN